MNITFLIGNGFDINLGMKTRYSEFLESYLQNSNNDSKLIEKFKRDIKNEKDLWSFAERAFGKYTNNFSNEENGAEDFCECHEDFCNKLADYLDNEENKLTFGKDNTEISRKFANAISNYHKSFREAQQIQIDQSANNFGEEFVYSFINFNYTKTLDKFIKLIISTDLLGQRTVNNFAYNNRIGQVFHVHGYTDQDMILGVDNEGQIDNLKLFDDKSDWLKKQIIKQQTNEMNERFMDSKVKNLIELSDLIYIYGMSIGETDALWWKRIGDRMQQNQNVRLIIYTYDAPPKQRILTRYHMFEDEIKSQFVEYMDFSEEIKKDIKSRIHIDSDNIFYELNNFVLKTEKNDINKELVTA